MAGLVITGSDGERSRVRSVDRFEGVVHVRFSFQFAEVRFKSGFQFVLSAPKFSKNFAQQPPEFRQFLGPEKHKSDDENQHHLLYADRSHAKLLIK